MNTAIFLTAGGKGNRLRSYLNLEEDLPKALAVSIKNRPLIAYQLDILVKLNFPIAIAFSSEKAIKKFQSYIATGKIANYEYKIMPVPYAQDSQIIDVLKTTNCLSYFTQFDSICLSCEESYYQKDHLLKLLDIHKSGFNVVTIDKFEGYMINMRSHPQIIYDNDFNIKSIKDIEVPPDEVSFSPMFLTNKAFEIYVSMPIHTYRSVFLKTALEKGEKFKVLKPSVHVHMDYIEDYHNLINILK